MFSIYKSSKANTDDTKEIGRSIVATIDKHLSEDGFLSRQKQKLTEVDANLEQLQARARSNALTVTVNELDDDRDEATVIIEKVVESKLLLGQYDAAVAEAAKAVQAAFDLTPIKVSASYAAQTNQTDTRITMCNSAELRAHMATLEVLPIWDTLIAKHEAFKEANDEKDALESVKIRGTVREQAEIMKEVFRFVLPYMEAQAIDVAGSYDVAAKEVQESLARVMSVAEARATRKKNAE